MKIITHLKSFSAVFLLAISTLVLLGVLYPKQALAEPNINVLNSNDELASIDSMLNMTSSNIRVEWHGLEGIEYTSGDARTYYVPAKSSNGNWSYEDFADFYFTGNTIGEKEILINVHIDKLTVTDQHRTTGSIGKYFKFAYAIPDLFSFGGSTGHFTNEQELFPRNEWQFFVDYTVNITWADTGKAVNMPFYQILIDIDAGSNQGYFTEAWEAKQGFSGDFYIYDKCYLDIQGTRFISPYSLVDGSDSLTRAGVIALTDSGNFSGQFEEGDCGTGLQLYSQFAQLPDPVKSYSVQR